MAMPTPCSWRQQPAAAAAQLRRSGGRGPQRVLVADVSTALETSAAAGAVWAVKVEVLMRPVGLSPPWLAMA
jgi:hypothetical protein